MLGQEEGLAAEVPLADAGGTVMRLAEGLGQRELLERQGTDEPPLRGFALGSHWPDGSQSVRSSRAGYLPVSIASRVGEQTAQTA